MCTNLTFYSNMMMMSFFQMKHFANVCVEGLQINHISNIPYTCLRMRITFPTHAVECKTTMLVCNWSESKRTVDGFPILYNASCFSPITCAFTGVSHWNLHNLNVTLHCCSCLTSRHQERTRVPLLITRANRSLPVDLIPGLCVFLILGPWAW